MIEVTLRFRVPLAYNREANESFVRDIEKEIRAAWEDWTEEPESLTDFRWDVQSLPLEARRNNEVLEGDGA